MYQQHRHHDQTRPATRRRLAVLALAVTLAVAAGCDSEGTTRGRTAASANPSAAIDTSTPRAIADTLNRLGIPCTDYEEIANPTGALARGNCTTSHGDLAIGTYATNANVEDQWVAYSETMADVGEKVGMGNGRRWTVSGDDLATVERATKLLGGTYRESDVTATPTTAVEPKPSDFTVKVKILRRKCFGSAGCNVSFQIQPTYTGPALDPSETWLIIYEVRGVEDGPQVNSFEMTGDGTATIEQEETAGTTSAKTKLTAKVTGVTKA